MDIDKVRNLTDTELLGELVVQRRALYDLRFQLATRQLTDHSQLTQTRRSIARVLTVMTERELDETLVPRSAPQPKPVARAAAAKPAAKAGATKGAAKSAPKSAVKSATKSAPKSAANEDDAATSAPAKTAVATKTTRAKTAASAAQGDEK